MRGGAKGGAALGMGAPSPFDPAYPRATATTQPARTVPGAAFPAPPKHLFPPKPAARSGASFPPKLQVQQERSAQQAHRHVVMPARPGAGLVLVQSHVALASGCQDD